MTTNFVCAPWLIHVCGMAHSYVWHGSFTCLVSLIRMCNMTPPFSPQHATGNGRICISVRHDSFTCETWLIRTCDVTHSMWDMTHSYVCNDSFICVTWLIQIYVYDIAHSYVWHDPFTHQHARGNGRIYFVCNLNHSYVRHVKFICVTWLISMCDMARPHTGMPEATRAKMVCLPSRWGVGPSVMKNWRTYL